MTTVSNGVIVAADDVLGVEEYGVSSIDLLPVDRNKFLNTGQLHKFWRQFINRET